MPANEKVCCGALEELAGEFDLPFERPMLLKDQAFVTGAWTARLLSGAFIILNYCPFCGQDLREEITDA